MLTLEREISAEISEHLRLKLTSAQKKSLTKGLLRTRAYQSI